MATITPIIAIDIIFYRPKILKKRNRQYNLFKSIKRTSIKITCLYSIFVIIAFIYWAFPEYRQGFYHPFFEFITPITPWLVAGAIPYFMIVDYLSENPEDNYYIAGQCLLKKAPENSQIVGQLFLSWLVKAFFLPLMFVYFSQNINLLLSNEDSYSFSKACQKFQNFYVYMWILFFTIDLGYACIGYCMTFKLLDSHIRSTDSTISGWVCALICYKPFWSIISHAYIVFEIDNYTWGAWLSDSPLLYAIWGSLILLCLSIYVLSTITFGIRFSNLTHRGVITTGPYRLTKHPAYISKNLSWWLIAIPFIHQSGDIEIMIRSCTMLAIINAVYYFRAKTEERHLMQDPKYQDYSNWIDIHGLYARLKVSLHR